MHLEGIAFGVGIGVVAGLLFWALSGRGKEKELALDERMIRRYFRERDEELLEIRWNPSMQNALAHDDVTDFDVVFRDGDGRIHRATARSMVGGVAITNDEIDQD
jgi:hypothetical protein